MARLKIFNTLEQQAFESPPVFNNAERLNFFFAPNEQPRSKLRGIEHPSLNSFRGKPRGIEPEEIDV